MKWRIPKPDRRTTASFSRKIEGQNRDVTFALTSTAISLEDIFLGLPGSRDRTSIKRFEVLPAQVALRARCKCRIAATSGVG